MAFLKISSVERPTTKRNFTNTYAETKKWRSIHFSTGLGLLHAWPLQTPVYMLKKAWVSMHACYISVWYIFVLHACTACAVLQFYIRIYNMIVKKVKNISCLAYTVLWIN